MTFQNFKGLFSYDLPDHFQLDLQNTNLYTSNYIIFHPLNISVWQRHALSNPLKPHTPLLPNSVTGCTPQSSGSIWGEPQWPQRPSLRFPLRSSNCPVAAPFLSPFHNLNQEDNPCCKEKSFREPSDINTLKSTWASIYLLIWNVDHFLSKRQWKKTTGLFDELNSKSNWGWSIISA